MNIGFTGTRATLPDAQADRLFRLLEAIDEHFRGEEIWLHHGSCLSGDERCHYKAMQLRWKIHVHPPDNWKHMAVCYGQRTSEEKGYLERNRDIVRASYAMIACPKTMDEPSNLRGQGTWWTINFARKQGTPIIKIFPDGSIEVENEVDWIREIL